MSRGRVARRLTASLALALAAAALAPRASAHSLRVFASDDGLAIHGYGYFVGGTRAREIDVRLLDATGHELGHTRADDRGAFALETRAPGPLELVGTTGDGHRAVLALRQPGHDRTRPAASPERGTGGAQADAVACPIDEDAVARAVARAVEPLAERLDSLEAHLAFRDVLGGLGYLVGCTGLALWITTRRGGGAS